MLAFAGFAFVASVTPGPNNAMLLASGVNYGFRRTLPHMAGISLGCGAMLLLVGLGLGQVFAAAPAVYDVLRWAGAAYLLWLAWRILRSGPMEAGAAGGRPLGFWGAALFQWVNPKAWILVVGAVSTHAPREASAGTFVAMAALLCLVNVPSIALWAGFGAGMAPLLRHPRRARAFNAAMALLLVASLAPMLVD